MLRRIISLLIIITVLFSMPLLSVNAKGANLVPQSEASMDNISLWSTFYGGKISQGAVGADKVLSVTGLGAATWHSPCYNIYDIIRTDVLKNGGGRYQISFNVMLKVTGNEEQTVSTVVRATNKTAIFDMPNNENTEFRKKLSVVFGKNGEWKNYSITIGIRPEDVVKEGEKWLFCFDNIPEAVTGMCIDDFSLCRYSNDSSQTVLMHHCMPSEKFASGTSSQATPTPTAAPTPALRVTPSAQGSTETGKNLIDEKTSAFDNVTTVGQTGWTAFSTIGLSISDGGYSGTCLKATSPSVTWASPCLNIFPYIKEAGTYTFSAMMKVTGGTDESNYAFIVRGTKANSFIQQRGGNFYGSLGSAKLKLGEWTRISGQFTVKEEDLKAQDAWTVCVSTVPLDVGELFIDEVVLIKGTEKQLPEMKEPDEGVSVNEGSINKYVEGELYKPELKNAMVTTSIITLAVVVVVISGKIFLPKLIKKGKKK